MRIGMGPRRGRFVRASIAFSLGRGSSGPQRRPGHGAGGGARAEEGGLAAGPGAGGAGDADFTYFLSYSCSSLSQDCTGATIVDVMPPELSRLASRREAGRATSRRPTTTPPPAPPPSSCSTRSSAGTTAQVSITAQFPAGTPVGTHGRQPGHRSSASNAAPVTSNQVDRHLQGGVEVDGDQERGPRRRAAPGRHALHLQGRASPWPLEATRTSTGSSSPTPCPRARSSSRRPAAAPSPTGSSRGRRATWSPTRTPT